MITSDPVPVAMLIGPMVALLVGMGQIGMIWWGLRQMKEASRDRSKMAYDQGRALEKACAGIDETLKLLREKSL